MKSIICEMAINERIIDIIIWNGSGWDRIIIVVVGVS